MLTFYFIYSFCLYDHSAQTCRIKITWTNQNPAMFIRQLREENINTLKELLQNKNWKMGLMYIV